MIRASAPGKILWIGGYSILHKGNVGHVLSVDRRVVASAEKRTGNEITFAMPPFHMNLVAKWDGAGVSDTGLTADEKNSLKFVRAAVECSLKYLKSKGHEISGLFLETMSDATLTMKYGSSKSGLGSSAAVTVASAAAVLRLYGVDDMNIVHKVAQLAHAMAQGKVGSGFDVAASSFGCIEYERYSPELINGSEVTTVVDKEWDYKVTPSSIPKKFLVTLAFTGKCASTTELVKKVMEFEAKNPEKYGALMKELNTENVQAIKQLQLLNNEFSNEALDRFVKHFESGRLLLKELGVQSGIDIESDEHSRLIALAKENGAVVAKLPGAGSGDSIMALCLTQKDREAVDAVWKENGLLPLEIEVCEGGVVFT